VQQGSVPGPILFVITTSLLGVDVDFATQVATLTRLNSHVMWTT